MSDPKDPSLEQERPLTEEDIRFLIRKMDSIVGTHNRGLGQVIARFTLEQIRAVRRFERSSTRLTYWLIVLTFVLVVLTGAIAWLTWVLVHRPGS